MVRVTRCRCAFSAAMAFGPSGIALVKDEPVVVHCYTTPADIQDATNLAELGSFCRRMGREGRQGEIGLVIGDEYVAIGDFADGGAVARKDDRADQ